MRGTLIVRPLAADTIVYTVVPYSNDRFAARFADPFVLAVTSRSDFLVFGFAAVLIDEMP